MTSSLSTSDGLRLQLHRWPCADAHGTVLIVHGLGEHGGRYGLLAAALNAWGWQVIAYDHRGHGLSDGPRGHIPHSEALLTDLAAVIDAVREPREAPLVLLGHSMGGLVASRFVAEALLPEPAAWARTVEGLVLSSPALAVRTQPMQRRLLSTLGRALPDIAIANGLRPEWICSDAAAIQAYLADPLVHDRITPRLVRFIMAGGTTVRSLAPRWRVPTLLMWSPADRCIDPQGCTQFVAGVPGHVLRARPFERMAHELLNERDREQVLHCLRDWLKAQRIMKPGVSLRSPGTPVATCPTIA